jgi:hypothetical protein
VIKVHWELPALSFEWVGLLKKVHERRIVILAFANNHSARNGPATVELFRSLWGDGLPKPIIPPRIENRPRFSTRNLDIQPVECVHLRGRPFRLGL